MTFPAFFNIFKFNFDKLNNKLVDDFSIVFSDKNVEENKPYMNNNEITTFRAMVELYSDEQIKERYYIHEEIFLKTNTLANMQDLESIIAELIKHVDFFQFCDGSCYKLYYIENGKMYGEKGLIDVLEKIDGFTKLHIMDYVCIGTRGYGNHNYTIINGWLVDYEQSFFNMNSQMSCVSYKGNVQFNIFVKNEHLVTMNRKLLI